MRAEIKSFTRTASQVPQIPLPYCLGSDARGMRSNDLCSLIEMSAPVEVK